MPLLIDQHTGSVTYIETNARRFIFYFEDSGCCRICDLVMQERSGLRNVASRTKKCRILIKFAFYFGFLEIEPKNNFEISIVLALAMVVLIFHSVKILKQTATQNL